MIDKERVMEAGELTVILNPVVQELERITAAIDAHAAVLEGLRNEVQELKNNMKG